MIRSASGDRCRVAPWIGVATIWLTSIGLAAEPWADVKPRPETMVGSLSCMSASCHGGDSQSGSGSVSSRQYVHWLAAGAKYSEGRQYYDPRARLEASDSDPHALAAQRMGEPRFLGVLRRASLRADGSIDGTMHERCAKCHDPLGVVAQASGSEEIPLPLKEVGRRSDPGEGLQLLAESTPHALTRREREAMHGIGCESCHGGARDWLARHYERDATRDELLHLGMIDTKNLFLRARQCTGCHVGSADKDMNHDMIAAGHPPLRFELASYEALLPRKHWDDRPQRMADPDYEVQLWAAGRIAAADAALALLEARAGRAAEGSGFRVQGSGDRGQETGDRKQGPARWPELAELNCFGCHQPLRGGNLALNRHSLSWRTWDVSLAPLLLHSQQRGAQELPAPSFAAVLGRLQQTMDSSLSPPPDKLIRQAGAARAALRNDTHISASGSVLRPNGTPLDAASLLRGLASTGDAPTWDNACQRLAALIAAERSLDDRGLIGAPDHRDFVSRMKSIAADLRFQSTKTEWPVVFSSAGPTLADAIRRIDNLRTMLISIAAKEPVSRDQARSQSTSSGASILASPGAGLLPAKEAAE